MIIIAHAIKHSPAFYVRQGLSTTRFNCDMHSKYFITYSTYASKSSFFFGVQFGVLGILERARTNPLGVVLTRSLMGRRLKIKIGSSKSFHSMS